MKICTIIGARPQFIKAAAISRIIALHKDITEILIHTGQHYDHGMSDVFFEELGIPHPDYNLGIGSGLHGEQTGKMLIEIEKVLLTEKPDFTLIYGDTNSTLAAAIASAKLNIPVAHIEAGLRSFNRDMPEEINRIAADAISTVLFTPTQIATDQLKIEGHEDSKVVEVGDVMYDVMLKTIERINSAEKILAKYHVEKEKYMLVTIHRAENTDNSKNLLTIIDALSEVAKTKEVLFPLHPRTKAALKRDGLFQKASQNLNMIDPLGYLEMTALLNNAWAVATDSGGVQKEAFFHCVPCFTLRNETEWVELVKSGWNIITPPSNSDLAERMSNLDGFTRENISPYGQGDTAQKIVKHLLKIHK